jgi:hypothetical protein
LFTICWCMQTVSSFHALDSLQLVTEHFLLLALLSETLLSSVIALKRFLFSFSFPDLIVLFSLFNKLTCSVLV